MPRSSVLRGGLISPRKVDTHARLRNKRKPPRGMFLSAEGLTSFATAPAAHADALLKKFDAELIELKRQVLCCSILLCLLVACLTNHHGSSVSNIYFLQGGYVFIIVCLPVRLLATSKMDLHKIFREGWQSASEEMIKFWWLSRYTYGSHHW